MIYRLRHWMKTLPTQSRQDSLGSYSNSLRSLQLCDHLRPSDSSAKDAAGLGRRNTSLVRSTQVQRYYQDSSDYKKYLCEYIYGDSRWSVEIWAKSYPEALSRLKAIGSDGKILGIVHAEVPVDLGWITQLWVWLGNLSQKS